MTKIRKKASDLYKKQNTLIHKAMAAVGMPYQENKGTWVALFEEVAGRDVKGLSDLTLGERHAVIQHFRGKGIKLYAPGIPEKVRDWKKGDPDVEYEFREDEDPQIRMIYALWNEMGYKAKSLRGLQLVNLVLARAKAKGCGHYYRKTNGTPQLNKKSRNI